MARTGDQCIKKPSLRFTLVFYFVCVAALVCAAATMLSLHVTQMSFHDEVIASHRDVPDEIAAGLIAPMIADDLGILKARLVEAKERYNDIQSITVYNQRGVVIAHEQASWARLPPGTPKHPVRVSIIADLLSDVLATIYLPPSVIRPIVGPEHDPIGTVQIAFSAGRSHTFVAIAAEWMLIGSVLALCAAGTATFFFAGRLTRPIARAADAVVAMSKDDFNVRIPMSGPTQVAMLAHGLNQIAGRMRSVVTTSTSMAEKTSFINNVVDSMVDSMIVVDQQARIKAVNQATLDLLGYASSELLGRTSSIICVADGFHLTATRLEQLLGPGALKDHEVCFISKDNRHIPISLSGSAVKDRNGTTTGYVCLGTDITHRKEAEAEREKLNRQLMATSRQAGMAEVATGVLHNVGNVLNSVNVSASIVEEALRKSKVARLAQVSEMIEQHAGDLGRYLTGDEKGKLIPAYLKQLSQHLGAEQEQLLGEMRSLTRHVGHIKDIIGVQQSVAKIAGVVEKASAKDLLEDALRMIAASLERHRISVEREFEQVPTVETDKHKVLQILVNLLTNALDAMKETAGKRQGVLRLRIRATDAVGGAAPAPGPGTPGVRIEVADNGIGIAAENLTKIFTHGFTTKKEGHGFGLHSAALAAKELQGSLTAASDGPGGGSVFVLALPCKVVDAGVPA